MKKIVLGFGALVVVLTGLFVVLNAKDGYDASKYSLSVTPAGEAFGVGSSIDYLLPDQFDKSHELGADTKKLIFAFTKDTGHIIKTFMLGKPAGFLESKSAVIVADISGMPTIIRNAFALPDLKKSNYDMVLIYDKQIATQIKTGQDASKVIVMSLDNKQVTKVEKASNPSELTELLQ